MKPEIIPISKIALNTGQIPDVPKNPRFIKDERFEKLKKSLQDDPEMMELRELIVYPFEKKFVVIGGNMRLRAAKELGYTEMPCKVLKANTPPEKLRAYLIKDNTPFGNTDFDMIANEWDTVELKEWGFELPADMNTEIADIEDAVGFNEQCSFTIKCKDIEQLEQLKQKLDVQSNKIEYDKFLIKSGL